jgi:hypothetical protein
MSRTAVLRVAHEADTSNLAGRPLVDPPRFGMGMPVIAPGDPPTSYLLYKLLINPANFFDASGTCTSRYSVSGGEPCFLSSSAERHRLQDWFVRLDPMPPEGDALAGGVADLRTLQEFVHLGAETSGCP